jgi:hypothetical protein
MVTTLVLLARAPVELAEAEVAVGDERAHAEFCSQRHGLKVLVASRYDACVVPLRGDKSCGTSRLTLASFLQPPEVDQSPESSS